MQGLHPEAVACRVQALLVLVPHEQGEHDEDEVEAGRAPPGPRCEHDLGVGAQDHGALAGDHLQQAGAGFFPGDAADVGGGRFAGFALLGNIDIEQAELQAQLGEQFTAAR